MKIKMMLCTLLLSLSFVLLSLTGCSDGIDGKNGTDGKDGADGTSIIWKGSYANSDDASLANPEYMWAYYNTSDGCSYVYNGKEWTLLAGTPKKTFDIKPVNLTEKMIDLRIIKDGTVQTVGARPIGFITGNTDIPYIPLTTVNLQWFLNSNYTVSSVTKDTTEVTITNTARNAHAVFDLSTHKCTFDNYDAFFQTSDVYYDTASVSKIDYMKITDAANIAGKPVIFDWSTLDIGITLCKVDTEYALAVPLQTFNDVFLSPKQNFLIYNGMYLYTSYELMISQDLQNDYYTTGNKSRARNKVVADFCYNELCLNLDFNYGLKTIHGIDSFPDFNTYFACVGIRDDLMDTGALIFSRALKDICEFYFGDGHSNYILNSHYLGKDASVLPHYTSLVQKDHNSNYNKYSSAKSSVLGSPVPLTAVSSNGETVIVRFDEFSATGLKKNEIIAQISANNNNPFDVISFIHMVNSAIHSNSSIKNIVLDLSCNGGGDVSAAAFVLSWMLGECTFNFTNPVSGAKWFSTYKADVNLDGVYDENDTVNDKNLFCLISPCSFSCGNLVPAMLKASGNATIIGSTSGGGTSVVQYACTADGTLFRMSSKYVMSVVKNGSTYNIDTGVEPHYYISDPKNYYNTETIAKLVDAINKAKMGESIF